MSAKSNRLIGALLLLLFGGLTVAVMGHAVWVTALDQQVQTALIPAESPLNTAIFNIIAFCGSPAIVLSLTFLLCIYLWRRGAGQRSLLLGGLQLAIAAGAELVKFIVQRPRPTQQLTADTGFSFPSGHTVCTAVLVFSILLVIIPLIDDQEQALAATLIGIVWIGLVAGSRVYLRDHFASDILGGLLFASGCWLLARPFAARVSARLYRLISARLQNHQQER